jgi:formylglycine-generating enzyme required for sulfatase activity
VDSKSVKGDGRWGQADLAGYLWEWVLDGVDVLNPNLPPSCDNCAALSGALYRQARGGGFLDAATAIDTFFGPSETSPTTRYINYGARCARSAP